MQRKKGLMLAARHGALLVVLASSIWLLVAGPAAAGPDSGPQVVPLAMTIKNAPYSVPGADGKNHLAYEITIVNQTAGEVTIESVQPRTRGKRIGSRLQGEALAGLLRLNDGGGPAIPAGGSALLFMDVRYPIGARRPKRLSHAVRMSLSQPSQPSQSFSFKGVTTAVRQARPIVVARPLRGRGWVTGNGCCDPINAHRGATLSIDGTVHVPERFAIDWVQIAPSGRLFEGPLDQNSSYAFFGDPIYSVAPGRVVDTQDGQPEQTPGALPPSVTVQEAGGNYIVVKIAPRRFAFYAHMQPGSLRVKKGERVRQGQVLGLLGNTGNTDAPHLHFHVMDSPSPLESNGLPFVHSRFRGQGLVTDEAPFVSGEVVPIDRQALSGNFRLRMPIGRQVVDFGR